MSSPITAQPQYGASAQSGLPPFMASQPERGSQAGDDFSRTLQNRMDAPRERNPERAAERPAEATAQRERPQAERPRNTEHGRRSEHGRRAEGTERSTERTDASAKDDAPASEEAAAAEQAAGGGDARPQDGAEAGKAPASTAATAALPAAIAALIPALAGAAGGTGAAADATSTETDPLADVLRGGKQKTASNLLAGADDSKGKSLQNALADKSPTLAEPSTNATRIASLVAQLQSRGSGAVTAFTESPAKAMQALQGEPPTSLQSVFAPRANNPLQPGPQLQVATPVGQNGWAEDVGSKVIWMTSRGESKAELVITPPNLGKVEVSINMNGDQATAQFLASTREAKEALEQALPRLRELMAQSGVNLGQTSVNTSGDQRTGQEDASPRGRHGRDAVGGVNEAGGSTASGAATWTKQGEGLVDIFA